MKLDHPVKEDAIIATEKKKNRKTKTQCKTCEN
jgi:hypothetical protein